MPIKSKCFELFLKYYPLSNTLPQKILLNLGRTMAKQPRPKVFVSRSDYPVDGIKILTERYDVETWSLEKGLLTKEEMLKQVKGKCGLFISLPDKIDKEIIKAAGNNLKVISTMSVGVDHIDLIAAKNAGVRVGYTPDVLTEASAELTVALLLATSRRLFVANKALLNGEWKSWAPLWLCGSGLNGSTVGIFGMGRIGLSVAKKLLPFGVRRLLYTGRGKKKEGDEIGAIFTDFDCLLKESDFVIVNSALTSETKGIFTAEKFALMKPTAVFINTSRGAIIDQDALVQALKGKVIAAAGLDVMTPEPLPTDHPLTKLNNCVLLPHIGSATNEARNAMGLITAKNIIAALDGEPMPAEMKYDIARDAGYKDSGIVIGKNGKIVLAIRNKNNLEVPVSNGEEIIVKDSFIKYCVDLANKKMDRNFEQIKKFENGILLHFKMKD